MKTKLLAAIAACAFAVPAAAQSVAGTFAQGRTHFVVTAGTGYAFDETYLILGLGASYYVLDGLNVGLFVESWSGSDPGMTKITPSVQYIQAGRNAYIGVGAVYESYLDCSSAVYRECDSTYAEVSLTFAF